MTASPLFSIVLPTYNRSAMLGRAIQSVFDQDFGDFELVVVDDGSDDPYVSAWEGCDRRIRILRTPDNRGVSAARNLGIAAARGKYVSFLDDDDEYAPTFLSSTRSLLCDAAAGVALSWCGARFVDDTLVAERRSDRTREFHETRLGQRQLFEGLLSIGTGFGVTIDLQHLREIGAFDCSLRTVEDTDLFLRFLIRGLVPAVVPGVHVMIHHVGQCRMSGPDFHPIRIRECRILLRRYADFFDRHPTLRQKLLRHIYVLRYELAVLGRSEEA